MKLKASSFQRYNGGAAHKRRWGSSTITRFYVWRSPEDDDNAKAWLVVEGYGKTPGERKTDAMRKAEAELLKGGGV